MMARLAAALLAPMVLAHSVAAQELALDRWPRELAYDQAALQRGARLFVNYCLNCHSATQMRWNRLRDIGEARILTELCLRNPQVPETTALTQRLREVLAWSGMAPASHLHPQV